MFVWELPAAILSVLVLGVVVYATLVEPRRIRLSGLEIRIADLPEALDGYTICHLSDLHTVGFGPVERRLKTLLTGVRADLCVITGDLAGRKRGMEAFLRVLADFRPAHGIYAVRGNNDYPSGAIPSELGGRLRRSGVNLLENSHATLSINNAGLHIIGVEDPYSGRDDLSAAMSGLEGRGPRILLAHSPDILMRLGAHQVDLVLAGHTHGGQIRVPVIGPLWLHCRYTLGISSGYYGPMDLVHRIGEAGKRTQIFVSRGIGGSGIRARFLCPPEIAVLTLRRAVCGRRREG